MRLGPYSIAKHNDKFTRPTKWCDGWQIRAECRHLKICLALDNFACHTENEQNEQIINVWVTFIVQVLFDGAGDFGDSVKGGADPAEPGWKRIGHLGVAMRRWNAAGLGDGRPDECQHHDGQNDRGRYKCGDVVVSLCCEHCAMEKDSAYRRREKKDLQLVCCHGKRQAVGQRWTVKVLLFSLDLTCALIYSLGWPYRWVC